MVPRNFDDVLFGKLATQRLVEKITSLRIEEVVAGL
jgi:hypothetical protein